MFDTLQLNQLQQEVVNFGVPAKENQDLSPLLIIAGAGKGKTKPLAHRLQNLL
ncbi:hypothetical protein ACOYR1_08490 [Thalassotalea piscium]